MSRTILHVDMDAFYASVEQRDHPELRGKPVLVAGAADRRGVVSAASYEARRFGCRSAMPTSTAVRLCPQAVVVPVRISHYRAVSRQVFTLFEEFSPLIEPLSIDEAFLDLSGTEGVLGPAEGAAARLKRRITEEVGLTASVGVAPNKFLAKLASDLRKPDGLVVVPPDGVQQLLDPLPVERLWGVGPATLRRLEAIGVRKIADLRRLGSERLSRELGSAGAHLHRLAHGLDDRPVSPDTEAKSISHEQTFGTDLADPDFLRGVLMHQVEDVGYRLRRHELFARTLTLKIRYADFTTLTRSTTLPEPVSHTPALWAGADELFRAWQAERPGPLRLLGFGASNLLRSEARQLSLFSEENARAERLDAALDRIRERFGPEAVRRRTPGTKG
ncbi:MAG: DNA polymerase IV [Armatimonadota bacterium]